MDEQIEFEFQVSTIEANDLEADADVTVSGRTDLEAGAGDPFATAGFVGVVSIVVAVSLSVLAKKLVDLFAKSKERGVMIDLRKSPPRVTTVEHVPAGFLVIVDKDGNAKPHQAKYEKGDDLAKLLGGILQPVGGG
jgi:hypothetical protein